jgi:hypothetical protein
MSLSRVRNQRSVGNADLPSSGSEDNEGPEWAMRLEIYMATSKVRNINTALCVYSIRRGYPVL